MTAFNYMSHGTQDLYATYLQKQRGFNSDQTTRIAIIYAVGMICGGTVVGYLSQHWGRRRVIILSAVFGMLLIPLWIFAPSTALLVVGGFLIQFMVQGAWGVVPVTLKRTFAAGFSRDFSGTGLPIGELCRRLRRAAAGLAGNEFLRDE